MSNGLISIEVQVVLLSQTAAPATGAWVLRLQQMLNDLQVGPLDVDGQFGPKTESAVKKFQQKMGLQVDGVVGAQTWPDLINNWFL
jgi:peptidoglycan hydrolase-like protein with peptidoglycan-binding domain